jgi:hypothetical protein
MYLIFRGNVRLAVLDCTHYLKNISDTAMAAMKNQNGLNRSPRNAWHSGPPRNIRKQPTKDSTSVSSKHSNATTSTLMLSCLEEHWGETNNAIANIQDSIKHMANALSTYYQQTPPPRTTAQRREPTTANAMESLKADIFKERQLEWYSLPFLRLVCTLLCIYSLSTYRIIRGLLTRKIPLWVNLG